MHLAGPYPVEIVNLSAKMLEAPRRRDGGRKKRNTLEIVSEMLEVAAGGSRKTRIMYRANLSYDLLVDYLSLLRKNGLLESPDESTFFLTNKGSRFLKEFREFRELHDVYAQKAQVIQGLLGQGGVREGGVEADPHRLSTTTRDWQARERVRPPWP